MTRSKFSTKAVVLATAIGLSTVAFARSQPAAAQSYPCPAGFVYDPAYGVGAQYHRQLPPLARVGDAFDDRGAAERDAVEEAQGANGDVEAGPRDAGRREVDL